MNASNFGFAVNLTATGTVNAVPGRLIGFYVNSTSSGTVVLRDGGASGRVLCGTITPAIGFHWFPAAYSKDLHFTEGGTIDITFFIS